MENKRSDQFNFIWIGVTVLLIAGLSFFIDISEMKAWVVEMGVWAPLAFIALKILTIVIAPLSGGPLYPLVGVLFGFWPGILYVAIGDFLGYTTNFFISRKLGRKIVDKMLGSKDESLLSKMIDHVGTTKGFFHAFLTLFVSPELLSYAAGLSKLSYVKFILILWPGYLVISSLLVFFGSIFNFSSSSFFVSILMTLLAVTYVLIGGTLFIKSVKNKH